MSRHSKTQGGASRKPAPQKTGPRSNVPGWVWMFTGIVTGLFIAFLMKLAPNAVDVRELTEATDASTHTEDRPRAVFDFYTLLPESEVMVPETSPTPPPASRPATATNPAKPGIYLLQAGSFRSLGDADRLRAQLTLEGLDVKTQKVTIRGNETWYRVQVGPFQDTERLNQARKTLIALNINPLPLQLK
ncbi:SPOR domain-containing protein [Aestuariirhabdus litorea]|uniref:SPOR domain-containing protein n=1 Tax=Aestuariirhabdus litorea TaxID=2528527 RepID=A0A3P3VL71_9GAMM|nr:SPOR domain-containing protein [Aestuariirhabdus litorea]RRJ83144.1 SPOR domain-containing protein [Aestuariirhabdus litorea]RWW93301.1 SPOR domain-containing protein [Endozoicomonadaceae bacterium GTF-13]